MKLTRVWAVLATALVAVAASAHDIWLETNSAVIRQGDVISLSLMLGNHGNEHRDFRLASKIGAGKQNLVVYGPNGRSYDLTPELIDTGYAPQEGFWTTTFAPDTPGLYTAVSTFDQVMSYAPVRDIKSAKTCFVVSKSLDRVPTKNPGFNRVYGHPLEIVPISNPVTPMGPGIVLKVRVLYKGKPLAGNKVSFIPRGTTLSGTLDPRFEKLTNARGEAQLTLTEAKTYLIVTHVKDGEAKGVGYESIGYSASLTLIVPGVCPCCAS